MLPMPCLQGCALASPTTRPWGTPQVGLVLPKGIKWVGAPLQPPYSLCRRRVGQDLTLPTHTLLLSNGLIDSGPHAAEAPLTLAAQRFYHILHTASSAGEHEKVVQVSTLYPVPSFWVGEKQEASTWSCSLIPRQWRGDDLDVTKLEKQWEGSEVGRQDQGTSEGSMSRTELDGVWPVPGGEWPV